MPTVLRIDGYVVIIYPNDHRPAHVHVEAAGCEAVFKLNCPGGLPELRENYGFSKADLRKIYAGVVAALASLCQEWKVIHGTY